MAESDEAEAFNVDEIISKLLEVRGGSSPEVNVQLTYEQIRQLCFESREIFLVESALLELNSLIKVCGDTHGHYYHLLRLFEMTGFPPVSSYLFLGNYVGRGRNSMETISLLLAYKIKYPHNFFLLRGNHEYSAINRIHGFYDECKRRYNIRLWKILNDCFNCFPIAAIINKKIFCCHGGLSPYLQSMEQIREIVRPTKVSDEGLITDLLWSDPNDNVVGWDENPRGLSYVFGADVVDKFLEKHDFSLICRSHQFVDDGYEFFAKRRLVTIFSAPDYCGYENFGAVMSVDDKMFCSFHILSPYDEDDEDDDVGDDENDVGDGE